jgi:hypothetical protein
VVGERRLTPLHEAPVVVAGGEHWSGFRPDRIRAIAGGADLSAASVSA